LSFRTTTNTSETIEQVRSNAADVGFASLPVRSQELKIERLFDDELILVVNKEHCFAQRSSVEAKNLAGERFILYEQQVSVRQVTDAFFEQVEIEPVVAVESNDTDFILQMVAKGIGISFLPVWAITEELRQSTLRGIFIVGHELRRSVAICHLKSNP